MLSINDVAEIIEETSLTDAILEGISPSRIKDVSLSDMFEETRDLLIRIQEHIDRHAGEDDDDSDDELY